MEGVAHHSSNLTGIAIVVVAAMVCGMFMERIRQPAFVGYIAAGTLLGPTAFGFVDNEAQISTIAELGVLMLLFVIGMELSLRLFLRLWRFVLLATCFQIGTALAVTFLLSFFFDWSFGMAILLGFVIALSSTAVAIKILENAGELKTRTGLIAIGILIAQDLAFVPMILILGIISVGEADYSGVLALAGSILVMAWLMWYLAKGGRIQLPFLKNAVRNMDLTPLSAIALCFGAAAVSGLLGLSPAYGAFLTGLVLGNSGEGHTFVEVTRPIQSVLMMVFFLSVGLLIDLQFIWNNVGTVLLLLFLVAIFKTAMNTAILRILGQSWPQAFLVSVMLAQIGEFSFLLSTTGLSKGLIGQDVLKLVVAVTVLSLAISPIWVVTARRLHYLTSTRISTFGELMKSVYAHETAMVANGVNKVRPQAALAVRRVNDAGKRVKEADLPGKARRSLETAAIKLKLKKPVTAANDNPDDDGVLPPDGSDGGEEQSPETTSEKSPDKLLEDKSKDSGSVA